MSEVPKQEWLIEVNKIGHMCQVMCDGEPLYPCAVDLHMEVGFPTTLHLKFPIYGTPGVTFQRGDQVTARGLPMVTTVEIGGRCYRLIDMTQGDIDDGLFRERRASGDAHQPL